MTQKNNNRLVSLDATIDEKLIPLKSDNIPTAEANVVIDRIDSVSDPLKPFQMPSGDEKIKLGSGVIDSLLGTGGMAKVYRVWNENLEVHRAVKLLSQESAEKSRNRFETEAKITAKLHHQNIIEIYNTGEWNGLPYIEMEYIDGITLDEIIKNHAPLPETLCCSIILSITRALSYAHTAEYLIFGKKYNGVIHRDLKPSNIILTKTGIVKLMDFGIAKPSGESFNTMDGHIVGTLQYLSPEQLSNENIDHRCDIYSLGAVLYEMLTGEKTFPQQNIGNLMQMKSTNSFKIFKEFEHPLSKILVDIAEKCLSTEKGHRYDTAEELTLVLEKVYNKISNKNEKQIVIDFMNSPKNFIANSTNKVKGKKLKTKSLKTKKHTAKIKLFKIDSIFKSIKLSSISKKAIIISVSIIISLLLCVTLIPMIIKNINNPKRPSINLSKNITKKSAKKIMPKIATSIIESPKPNILKPEDKKVVQKVVQKAIPKKIIRKKKFDSLVSFINKENAKTAKEAFTKAAKKRDFESILTVYSKLPTQKSKPFVFFNFWALIELGKYSDALKVSTASSINDALYDLLMGKLYGKLENSEKAIKYLQKSMTHKSEYKSPSIIRNDAMYYSTKVYDDLYKKDPNQKNRMLRMNALNTLKNLYSNNPENERFKYANRLLLK